MTTINTTEDLLRVVRENEEFRAAMRRELLSDEVLELPKRLALYAEATNLRLDRIDSDLSVLKADVAELKADVAELKEMGQSHTNDIGFLKGFSLESKLYNRGTSYLATEFNVYDIATIRAAERDESSAAFNTQLRDAMESGVITMEEYNRVLRTDMIASGRRPGVPGTVYVAVEASYTVHRADMGKVMQTKAILDKVFPDAETLTALFYTNIQPFIENEAYEDNIYLIKVDPLE
ncbi:MAG: hypothetical protein F4X34_00710 [Chloroflexi bacterium]|nr:hypothetical protein [Chloroflexota bacterium]